MGDFRRENAWFSVKWGILEEKTRDFCLNGGFSKMKTRDLWLKWVILEEKTRDFRLNGGFPKMKTHDFRVKWGILEKKTRDFRDRKSVV